MNKFLIVGLGNIGSGYENTRHNIGFKAADALAAKHCVSFSLGRLADKAEFKLKGRSVVIIKPTTYMNLSGKAVRYYLDKEKIPVENLLVILDDIAIPFGVFRLKKSGSSGGHNGLKSIDDALGSQNYARFRFGIGSGFPRGRQVDYVLGQWTEEETEALNGLLPKGTELVESFVFSGADFTMNLFNR